MPSGIEKFWAKPTSEILIQLETTESGLSSKEADSRISKFGLNSLEVAEHDSVLRLLARQILNPIMLILIGATLVSIITGDHLDGLVILAIVIPSLFLGFWQEYSAGKTLQALTERVKAKGEVLRDGLKVEINIDQAVPGDVVLLNAGDLIPGDGIVLEADSLDIDESVLTGESFPVTKSKDLVDAGSILSQRSNSLFFGTHVVSGTGKMLVVNTGLSTEIGKISKELETGNQKTSFEVGATSFGLLLVRYIGLLLAAVFALNIFRLESLTTSLLFSVALAVGLTPQLLPVIVSVTMSTGAKALANASVLVRRLNALEDLGSMSVLCSDKTGTLTQGVINLDKAIQLNGSESKQVLDLASLNACLQTGYTNVLDEAINRANPITAEKKLLDEIPYDFDRKRLSVLVEGQPNLLITKGAVKQVLAICNQVRTDSGAEKISQFLDQIDSQFKNLSSQGYRVLAVATKEISISKVEATDESQMILEGFLAFLDPLKAGVRESLEEIRQLGIDPYLITGDNPHAAQYIADSAGFDAQKVLTGSEITQMSPDELKIAVTQCHVFAEIEPLQKVQIVKALQENQHSVGLLGDGINDAPAIRESDVGMSVDTAVEVAKSSASIVLLDKDLSVIATGVRLGRRTFANTLKYIKVTISANFGNVLSMAIISVFLPFLPLLPIQILLLNFISDIPALTIATDRVDTEEVKKEHVWNVKEIRKFMVTFGLVSSIFDLATFAILVFGLHASATEFRSAWFVESTLTEILALLVLRTSNRFWKSKPSKPLAIISIFVAIFAVFIPFLPFAKLFGMEPLPADLVGTIGLLALIYVAINEITKRYFYRSQIT